MRIFKTLFSFALIAFLIFSSGEIHAQWNLFKKDKRSGEKSVETESYFIEAEKYFILEDYSKALVLFQKALEIEPDNSAIHYKLAETFFKSEDYDTAINHIKEALELEQNNKFYYLLAAEIYTKKNDYTEAANIYEELLTNIPGTEEYLFDLANIYIYQEKYKEALDTYQKAEQAVGLNEHTSYQIQRLYLRLNDLESAIAEAKKLIESLPGEPKYLLSLADILVSNNREQEAIPYLEEALELDPNNGKARLLLANVYKKTSDIEQSRENLKLAFENPNVDINIKVQVLINDYMQQFPDKDLELIAKDLADRLLEAHPEDGMSYAIYGDLYFRLNQLENAKIKYLKAIEKGHNNFAVWQNVLQIGMSLEQYDDVLELSEEALELYPNQAMLYLYNGTANMIKKHNRAAIEVLEQGKKLATSNLQLLSMIYGQLGDAYNNTEEYEKSDEAFEAALDANPDNDHVLNNYSYFLALRKEKLSLAKKMSAKLIKMNPEEANYLDTHAWVLYNLGEYEQAKRIIEKAIKKDANGTIIEHYGDILYKLGDVDGAVKQWQKAKGMDETSDLIDKKIADRKLYE